MIRNARGPWAALVGGLSLLSLLAAPAPPARGARRHDGDHERQVADPLVGDARGGAALVELDDLRTLDEPSPAAFEALSDIAEAAARAKMGDDFDEWNELEHQFHSDLYAFSPLSLVRDEFERLWLLSNIYRRLNMRAVGVPADSPAVTYYRAMLAALATGDRERMVALMTQLRQGSERRYTELLQRLYG